MTTFNDLIGTPNYECLAAVKMATKEVVGLQVADLIVHQYRSMLNRGRNEPLPQAMEQLMSYPGRRKFFQ
jgi:hypothetical protein